MEPDDHVLTVRAGGARYALQPGDPFSFGRAPTCTVCLDQHDAAISRLAGRIEHDGRGWWVENASASRQLSVVDEFGLRSVLPPGRRAAVESEVRVLVDGTAVTHEISIAGARRHATADVPVIEDDLGEPTVYGSGVLVNAADKAALVALFAGYLEQGPRYDPNPKSYAAAAARLGWPRTTLVKRIEYLRARLTSAGVPNLTGYNALSALAEWALTTGVITREDLAQLRR